MGVVSASQDSATNNTISTTTGGDGALLALQAIDDDKLSTTYDVSGSTVQDIKNLFDSGTVQEGDTIYLGNQDISSGWSQWGGPVIDVNVANVIISGGSSTNPNGFSTINANQARVFSFNADGITLKNVKIVNSQGGNGPASAVYIAGSDCTIENCAFDSCQVTQGGAIHGSDTASNTKIINSNFTNNQARWGGSGGAIYLEGSDNEIDGCNFDGNTADKNYGAVFSAGTMTVRNSNFTGNKAGGTAGAISIQGSDAIVENCNFVNNKASDYAAQGGALELMGSDAQVSNSIFKGNEANLGGAVYIDKSGATIANCEFESNNARDGGAINIYHDDTTITNCNFTSNSASSKGGAIYIADDCHNADMSYCNFEDNTAATGKAICADGSGDGKVTNCELGGVTDLSVTRGYPILTFTLETDYSNIVVGNIEGASGGNGSKVPLANEEIQLEIRDSNGVVETVSGVTDSNGQITYDYSHLPKDTYTYTATYLDGKTKEGTFGIIQVEGNGFSSIQDAINNAQAGDIIFLKDITYLNNIDGQMVIDKPLSIIGVEGTVLNAEEKSRIFNINNDVSDVVLQNIEFINGKTDNNGAAINIGENCNNVNIINSSFTDNHVETDVHTDDNIGHGGAIAIAGSAHNGKIVNSTFTDNSAMAGGGAVKNFGAQGWVINNSTFINNTAYGLLVADAGVAHVPNGGGAVWSCLSSTDIVNCTFIENEAPYGGAIRGFVNTYDCEFYENLATNGNGGAIDVTIDRRVQRPVLEFVNTTFVNNTAKGQRSQERAQGGALHMYQIEHVDISDCEFYNNTADRGGAIDLYIINTVNVDNSVIENNTATSEGGGLYINTTGTPSKFTNSNISNNNAGTEGGAICLVANRALFENVTSVNNTAAKGGSSYIEGNYTLIQNCTLSNNKALVTGQENSGVGGALDIVGNDCHIFNVTSENNTAHRGGSTFIRGNNTLVMDSSFDNNNATLRGGGLNIAGEGCQIINVNVTNNNAFDSDEKDSGLGGGLYIVADGTIMRNVTADNNAAKNGGGAFIDGDNIIIDNCTLSNNRAIYNESQTNTSGLGGALDILGNGCTVTNVTSLNNSAHRGGSTFIRGNNTRVEDCKLDGNNATLRGGGLNIAECENCTVTNVEINNNQAGLMGGGIYVVSHEAQFTNIIADNNQAERGGGAFVNGTDVTILNSEFNNNKAIFNASNPNSTGLGGGMDIVGNGCHIINTHSNNNTAYRGGSTFIRGNNTLIENCNLDNNSATLRGGAIYVRGNDNEFDNVTSVNNHAYSGGSTYITGDNTIVKDCTIVNNSAISSGGAIAIEGNNNNFTGNHISKNTAYMGGAISIDGENNLFTYNNITFNEAHNNDEYPLYSSGGAMAIQGENTNFTHNNISCNFADETGGAMVCYGDNLYMEDIFAFNNSAENGGFAQIMYANDLIIKNSTFLSNQATGNIDRDRGEGGAIHVSYSDNIDIQGDFSYNTATNGSAIYVQDSTLRVHDSTFFDNQAKSYLLIIDYDRWNSTANCTVKGVCNCTCNCSSHNVVNRENTMNNVHNRMLDKMRANGIIDLIRASNYDVCECECGCEGHCADDGSCDCSCEDYKYIATVYEGENITIIVYHKGGDNIANGMYNRDSDVLVNNISYPFYDKDGNEVIKQTPSEDINPVIGPENSHDGEDIYQYPFENNQIITIIVYNESGNVVKNVTYDEINKTDIYGATKLLLTNLTVGNYTVHAIYRESTYYTAIENRSSFRAIPIEDALVQKITVNETVLIGDEVQFVIIVNNTNPFVLHNITITEIFNSSQLEFVNYTNQDMWTRVNNTFTYNGNLSAHNSTNFTVIFKTLVTGTLINTVNLTTNETGNEIFQASNKTKVLKLLDKITVNETVFVGDNVDFIVVVTNHGIANGTNSSTNKTIYLTLHNVTITEIFNAAELKYLNHTNKDKWVINNTYNITKTVGNVTVNYTCMVFKYQGSLDVNEIANFTITFKTLKTGVLVNTVNLTTNETGNKIITANNDTLALKLVEKLTINKTAIVGQNVTFTIVVNNTFNITLHNITITEIFNSTQLEYMNHTNSDVWIKEGNVFKYKGNLTANQSLSFNITFKAKTNGTFVNTVNLTTNETGNSIDTANNTTVVYNPNMTVVKVSLNVTDFVIVNDTVAFNITVTNTGDCTLGKVNVTEQFNADEFKFIKIVGADWTPSDDNMTFFYGNDLVKGGNATFTIYFKALTNGTLVNNVTARSNVTNDTNSSANVTVYNPNMTVEKVSLNITDFVIVNNTVAFNITVTNTGDCTLGKVNVTEQFNADEFEFIKIVGADWTASNDNMTFFYGNDLVKGGNATFTIYFKALTNGTLVN
ncbi:right-handed parallel beta-helix repeat-containing protein, partial [Methanobrevibacter sp.]|uniref:right-handed parallel beta-helix repeat-containing protein n=1 Tax=Methanobrevibacter sp. TaxID=66852 RepID=UPI002E78DA7E